VNELGIACRESCGEVSGFLELDGEDVGAEGGDGFCESGWLSDDEHVGPAVGEEVVC